MKKECKAVVTYKSHYPGGKSYNRVQKSGSHKQVNDFIDRWMRTPNIAILSRSVKFN